MVVPLQIACIVLVSFGVAIELFMGAQLGFLLITVGGLSFGVATKLHALEHRAERIEEREKQTDTGISRATLPRVLARIDRRLRRANRQRH